MRIRLIYPGTTLLVPFTDLFLKPVKEPLLGGSGDLVSKVISTLIGVISGYKYSYLTYNPSY